MNDALWSIVATTRRGGYFLNLQGVGSPVATNNSEMIFLGK